MAEDIALKASLLDVRAVVFDLDGTLVDSRQDFVVALNRMLDDLRLPHIDEDFVTNTVGKGTKNLLRKTLKFAGQKEPDESLEQLASERYFHHYHEINGVYSKVFPGALEGLNMLYKQGYTLACLTNKPSALTGPLLVKKGLAHFFQCVCGGDAFIRQKPDPLPLLKVCEIIQTKPDETLMVGDSVNDAMAAHGACCPVALMRYGFNHGKPVETINASFYLDSLKDLPPLLKRVS